MILRDGWVVSRWDIISTWRDIWSRRDTKEDGVFGEGEVLKPPKEAPKIVNSHPGILERWSERAVR